MYIQYSAPTNVDTTQLWRELNNFCAVTRIQFIQELQPKTYSKFSIRKLYSIFEVPDIFLKHFLGPKISLISIEFKPRKCSVELKINLLKQRDLNIILNRSNHLFWSQTWMLCKHACYVNMHVTIVTVCKPSKFQGTKNKHPVLMQRITTLQSNRKAASKW